MSASISVTMASQWRLFAIAATVKKISRTSHIRQAELHTPNKYKGQHLPIRNKCRKAIHFIGISKKKATLVRPGILGSCDKTDTSIVKPHGKQLLRVGLGEKYYHISSKHDLTIGISKPSVKLLQQRIPKCIADSPKQCEMSNESAPLNEHSQSQCPSPRGNADQS
jgi:hypothetical protein